VRTPLDCEIEQLERWPPDRDDEISWTEPANQKMGAQGLQPAPLLRNLRHAALLPNRKRRPIRLPDRPSFHSQSFIDSQDRIFHTIGEQPAAGVC